MNLPENNYPVICYGEILWDLLPDGVFPGGAPMNVAYHLRKLGMNPALITKIGLDEKGKQLIRLMEKNDISTGFFQVDFNLPTGTVNASIGMNHEVSYDILKPVAWDNIQWDDQFNRLVSEAGYFIFGSLATRSEQSRNTLYRLLEMAKVKTLDINLRSPHYTLPVIEHLLKGVHLLKVNLAELELITGWFTHYKNERDRLNTLQDKFQIPNIVVTRGGNGSLFSANGTICEHPGFTIELADTIGSGDSFLAALITKLSSGADPYEALEFASATGALVASRTGPCPEYDRGDITAIIEARGAPRS